MMAKKKKKKAKQYIVFVRETKIRSWEQAYYDTGYGMFCRLQSCGISKIGEVETVFTKDQLQTLLSIEKRKFIDSSVLAYQYKIVALGKEAVLEGIEKYNSRVVFGFDGKDGSCGDGDSVR